MKKQVIGALVGGIILFVWQFLSWQALQFHKSETQFDADQHKIMPVISENLTEGQYFLIDVPEGTTEEQLMTDMEMMEGKAWATVNYHPQFKMPMAMNLIRGFVVDFIAAFLLCWILLRFARLDMTNSLLASLAVGFIGYLTIPYLGHIWYETSTMGYLIDAVGQWLLVGAWLGWYLPGKAA